MTESPTMPAAVEAVSATGFAVRPPGGVQGRKHATLFVFSLLYFAVTCYRASHKLFWFDELFTVYICRLPSMSAVWSALRQGVDFNPPLFYILTRSAEALFGEGAIATRLPEIVGFWVFCVCIFQFVSRRSSVLAATIAMLFPMVTSAYAYAWEARAHGIVLGFCGIAMVCWQAAAVSRRRNLWLFGFSGALVCALLTHTYAVLLFVPFGLAELARFRLTTRFDFPAWIALVTPLAGVLVSLPLIQASKSAIPGIFPPTLAGIVGIYSFALSPAFTMILAGLVVYLAKGDSSEQAPVHADEAKFTSAERTLLFGFAAMPAFEFALALITGAPFVNRYSISMVAGFACLLGPLAARRSSAGVWIRNLLIASVALGASQFALSPQVTEPSTGIPLLSRPVLNDSWDVLNRFPDKHAPLVILDNLEFLPMFFDAPPQLSARMVFAAPDSDAGSMWIGESFVRLQNCCGAPGRFEPLSELVSKRQNFVALYTPRYVNPLEYLRKHGADVRLESIRSDHFLATISFRDNQ